MRSKYAKEKIFSPSNRKPSQRSKQQSKKRFRSLDPLDTMRTTSSSSSSKPTAVAWTTAGNAPLDLADPVQASTHEHASWQPYDFNGGTTLAIAGKDFVVLAADTRLSTGYSILSRDESKIAHLTPTTLLASPGSHNDVIQLRGVLKIRAQMYEHDNGAAPSTSNMAQLLMNTLYSRRFFPYYAFCILCGIDDEGKGAVYTYDAIGSYDKVTRAAQGSGQQLMIPLLDNLVEHNSRTDPKHELSIQEVRRLSLVYVALVELSGVTDSHTHVRMTDEGDHEGRVRDGGRERYLHRRQRRDLHDHGRGRDEGGLPAQEGLAPLFATGASSSSSTCRLIAMPTYRISAAAASPTVGRFDAAHEAHTAPLNTAPRSLPLLLLAPHTYEQLLWDAMSSQDASARTLFTLIRHWRSTRARRS